MRWLKVVVIVLLAEGGELISTSSRSQVTNPELAATSLEMLWNLAALAIHTSNMRGRKGNFVYPNQVSPAHPGRPLDYGSQGYPQRGSHTYYPSVQKPHGNEEQFGVVGSVKPFSWQGPLGVAVGPQGPASLMDILHSVAQNDDLHCVPKLLCELTSNTKSDTSQSSLLPLNINMDSLLGLFSALGPASNPLFLFGRAALLGYSSHGSSCYNAFSRCPSDPDQLVNYLNNHNGGFFRYFNGSPQQHSSGRPDPYRSPPGRPGVGYQKYQAPHQRYPVQQGLVGPYRSYGSTSPHYAPQKRILANSIANANTVSNSEGGSKYPYRFPHAAQYDNYERPGWFSKGIKFPSDHHVGADEFDTKQSYKSRKTLTFPDGTSVDEGHYKQQRFRAGKAVSFPDTRYGRGLHFQMVRPNHIASPYIFPTRTGTGELLLDTEELY